MAVSVVFFKTEYMSNKYILNEKQAEQQNY